ncbi:MAG: acetyl-CoA acetyltransferase [Burkholderiaceae bacterium]
MDESRQPVLVGSGQVTQREPDPARALDPARLTAEAARRAAQDSGAGQSLLRALDAIISIRSFADTSWRFACPFGASSNPPATLARMIGADRAGLLVYTHPGGNMPQWCLNRLGEQIAAGELQAALVAGGESLATQKAAQRAGLSLDWSDDPGGRAESWGVDKRGWSDLEDRHGMRGAIFAYPLFEQAIRAARGRDMASHQQTIGQLLARFAAVAKVNPLADRRAGYDAATIATPGPDNPYIGFPYTRLMNANAFIDQSAAVIMTSVAKARELGIPESRWVYLHGCADGHDHWYLTERERLNEAPAMREVFRRALAMAGVTMGEVATMDLYSCFSSAVEVACESLDIDEDDPRGLTITGGLPYFGGPGNNYVTHSIAEMIHRLRNAPGTWGLVTANGNYLTKQSAGVYSTRAPGAPFAPESPARLQAGLDAIPKAVIAEQAQGIGTIETWTVMNERSGPAWSIVLGRLEDGRRFIANTGRDPALLARMQEQEMVGRRGRVSAGEDGVNRFELIDTGH